MTEFFRVVIGFVRNRKTIVFTLPVILMYSLSAGVMFAVCVLSDC